MMTSYPTCLLMVVTSSTKVLSSLAGVAKGDMPLQAVTNSLAPRFSRGSPVFVISSLRAMVQYHMRFETWPVEATKS